MTRRASRSKRRPRLIRLPKALLMPATQLRVLTRRHPRSRMPNPLSQHSHLPLVHLTHKIRQLTLT